MLAALNWHPYLVTHLGCIKGCLGFLGIDVSQAWLYGGTGHAFIINLHEALSPSGPTAWRSAMLSRLASNLGYAVDGVSAWRPQSGEGFWEKQRRAYDFVCASIDAGLPCYGWQLEVPDYYLIHGYDDVGYYYKGWGCEAGKGPLPWERLGGRDVTLLEVHRVRPGRKVADAKVVKDAVEMAVRHATGPTDWIKPGYSAGPRAFEAWAAALEEGRASRDGHTYNAQVWQECRAMAVGFLAEVKERVPRLADACDRVAGQYAVVRDLLADMVALHPPRPDGDWASTFASSEAASLAKAAAAAESAALAALSEMALAL